MPKKKEYLGKYYDAVGLFFMYSYHIRRLSRLAKERELTEQERIDLHQYSNEAQKCLMRSELHQLANMEGNERD